MSSGTSAAEATTPSVLPIHVAVHPPGCAVQAAEGVHIGSNDGPFIAVLAERVKRLTVVAYDPPACGTHREDLADFPAASPNIDVLSLGPKGSWRDLPARRRRVAEAIERHSDAWDVILFRLVNRRADLVFRANRCTRVVATLGGTVTEFVRINEGSPLRKAVAYANALRSERTYRAIARSSGRFFVNGEALFSTYEGLAPGLRLLRSSSRRASESFRAPDRLEGTEPLFVFVGAVTEPKGVFDVLEAFARVKQDVLPGARLGIVGSGSARERLEEAVSRRGLSAAVRFHGWLDRDRLFALLRTADVLLCLSKGRFESVPRVVHEAMAHSVLVVATRVAAIPHAFEDERHLLLVDEGDVGEVVERVQALVGDRASRRRILAEAFERAQELTLERVVGDLVEELTEAWPELARGA